MDEDRLNVVNESKLALYFRPLVLALIGAILVGVGVFAFRVWGEERTQVEVISGSPPSPEAAAGQASELVIEVAGAVINPGVYQLPLASRVEEALVAAGGLAANADRVWMSKYVNRAKKLADGEKVYIPTSGEMEKIAQEGVSTIRQSGGIGETAVAESLININIASQTELESLWGVGPVTAKKIISGRPYSEVGELLSRKIVKSNVFEAIKDQVSIY